MTEKTEQARKTPRPAAPLERGIDLDVLGRAIIAQADERIRWHKRTAGVMEGDIPIVIINGWGKSNPTPTQVAAEYERTTRGKS